MVEAARRARLTPEPFEALRVGGVGCRKDLDGDVAPDAWIVRAVDLAHTSRADQVSKLVVGPRRVPAASAIVRALYGAPRLGRTPAGV